MNLSTELSTAALGMDEPQPMRKFLFERSFDDELMSCARAGKKAVVTYSAQQMEAAQKESYENGVTAGQKTMMENQQQYMNVLLAQLDQKLTHITEQSREQWHKQLAHLEEMALVIMRKVLPSYVERNGVQEIEAIVEQVISEMAHEPRLVVRVGEAQFDAISAKIKEISEQKAYTGKVVVLSEPDLGTADCRIEWADGGIERDMNALWQSLDRILETTQTLTPPTSKPGDNSGETP